MHPTREHTNHRPTSMASIRGIFILTLLTSALSSAQSPGATTCQEDINTIIKEWIEGYNGGDASRVAQLYTEDAYYLTQHYVTGIVQGRTAIRAYVQHGIDAAYKIDSIETLYFDCSDDFGYVITRYHSTNAGQKVFGVNVVVLKRQRAQWMIVAHEAAVPDSTAIRTLNIPGLPTDNK